MAPASGDSGSAGTISGFPLQPCRRGRHAAPHLDQRQSGVWRRWRVPRLPRHRTRHHRGSRSGRGSAGGQGTRRASRGIAARRRGQHLRGLRHLRPGGPAGHVQRRLSRHLRPQRRFHGSGQYVPRDSARRSDPPGICRCDRQRGRMAAPAAAPASGMRRADRATPEQRTLGVGDRPAHAQRRHRRPAHRHHRVETGGRAAARQRGTAGSRAGDRRRRQLGTGPVDRPVPLVEGALPHPRPVTGDVQADRRQRRALRAPGRLSDGAPLDRRSERGRRTRHDRDAHHASRRQHPHSACGGARRNRCRRHHPPAVRHDAGHHRQAADRAPACAGAEDGGDRQPDRRHGA